MFYERCLSFCLHPKCTRDRFRLQLESVGLSGPPTAFEFILNRDVILDKIEVPSGSAVLSTINIWFLN